MIPAPSKGDIDVAELRQARGQEPARPQPEKVDASFDDLVDTLNPLQHIPGVASIYREVTGDEISGHAQVAGSTLYGGPIGMLSGAMQAAMTEESGKSMVDTVAAAFSGEGSTAEADRAPQRMAQQSSGGGGTAAPAPDSASNAVASAGTDANTGQRAATAALPTGMSSVLPPAGQAAAARADVASPSSEATTTQSASRAGDAQTANGDGQVLEGKKALAAFARDKAGVSKDAAAANAMAASGSAKTESADDGGASDRATSAQQTTAGQTTAEQTGGQQTAANGDFMKLRESDYNTSAEMRARSDKLQELQAQAANSVTPRVDANSNVDDDDSDPGKQAADQGSGIDPAGVPNDFASRMKEALSKYRTMHQNGE